jgi:hypothetical protein
MSLVISNYEHSKKQDTDQDTYRYLWYIANLFSDLFTNYRQYYWLETVLYKVIGWFIQLYNYRSISEDTIKSQEIIRIDYIRVIVGEIKKGCIRMLKH